MKSDLLRRLIRAIRVTGNTDLERVARILVAEEKRRGHAKLAADLQKILDRPAVMAPGGSPAVAGTQLSQLPVSRRTGVPLATLYPYNALRHHIVLPANVEAKFARIESEFASRERLAMFGLLPRKKILLYGPPGCGKTLGAECLAWKLGLPLLKARFDIIMSSYLGESAGNLREVFECGKESPRLLLLDECDSIAKARTQPNDVGEIARVVNSLLGLLEEYNAPGLLVATTNLSESLDPALFRRFDDVVEIPLPPHAEIVRLLQTTLSAMKVAENVGWDGLAERLAGSSAARVVQVATESAKTTVLRGEPEISQERIESTMKEG